jgi:REP element-mobilizing transposase RayT
MARKPRLHAPGALYHVIWRGNEQRQVFFDEDDFVRFHALLEEGVSRFGYRVHGYCLMPNHIHLALQAGKDPLSGPMQNLAFRYTQAINRKLGRSGHLFQGRYKALLVDQDAYLLQLVRYIHLNPVRARMVADPVAYPWSGHRTYLGKAALPWLTTETVLGQLGATLPVARRHYARFVAEGIGQGHSAQFYTGTEDPRVIGDDRFVERLQRAATGLQRRSAVDLDTLVDYVCDGFRLSENDLKATGRQRQPARARALIGWLAMETGAATLTAVAGRFGREPSGLSRQVVALGKEANAHPKIARDLRAHLNTVTHA